MGRIDKQRLIFGAFLIVLIIAVELLLHQWHLPGWPLFLLMIFFFEMHMDRSRAHHLICGGAVGILCYVATVAFVGAAQEWLPVSSARLLFICLVVYAIVAFGTVIPAVFNNYAFMFYLISGVAASAGNPAPWLWLGMVVVGGPLLLLAIMAIPKLMQLLLAPTAPAEDHPSN
ncbi:hypothetical protein [Pseudomaricurvus sp. HS19]|uniref:hypothetical protein n=1 Tax=Pseudomaricurvus sp. HS19 TaxID=2692626 RepID=UPI00136D2282|nr:hypothetical protein [Pseudomaricurvus sp. HS19]MYM64425.1 hypothetical protein [Pseudomaricurvus sp. HS19]